MNGNKFNDDEKKEEVTSTNYCVKFLFYSFSCFFFLRICKPECKPYTHTYTRGLMQRKYNLHLPSTNRIKIKNRRNRSTITFFRHLFVIVVAVVEVVVVIGTIPLILTLFTSFSRIKLIAIRITTRLTHNST